VLQISPGCLPETRGFHLRPGRPTLRGVIWRERFCILIIRLEGRSTHGGRSAR
jgi:hypothetical protein